jgi:hypothetical protein
MEKCKLRIQSLEIEMEGTSEEIANAFSQFTLQAMAAMTIEHTPAELPKPKTGPTSKSARTAKPRR